MKTKYNHLTKSVRKARKKPGGSNVGTYSSKETFAGPSGGAPKGSYPITKNGKKSLERAKAALTLARHAPNPGGIKRFVYSHFPSLNENHGSHNKRSIYMNKMKKKGMY